MKPRTVGWKTLEELLLIRDIDAGVLFGEDTNRNGVLDANENDAAATPPGRQCRRQARRGARIRI